MVTREAYERRKAEAAKVADQITTREIKKRLFASFSNVASLMGYSEVHGRIIAALTANDRAMSLTELAKETGYSASSISTSLDLLEVLGMVARVKKAGDRKLYVKLDGDLLEGLKRAIVMKGKKSLGSAFEEFQQYERAIDALPHDDPEREKVAHFLHVLREELERLQLYLDLLDEIQLPKETGK